MIASSTHPPLTALQRRLVAENLGLVAVHLRHFGSAAANSTREREDLFQEGCLGLIQAAMIYSPDCGIPFPAFALPRIHTAVSRAMRSAFTLVHGPIYDRRPPQNRTPIPSAVALDFEPPDPKVRKDHSPYAGAAPPSDDDEVRDRYERALCRAKERMLAHRSGRDDRASLLDRLMDDRLRVPEPEMRQPLRAIARETGSSFARVAQCEKRLVKLVRAELEGDAVVGKWRRQRSRVDKCRPEGQGARGQS